MKAHLLRLFRIILPTYNEGQIFMFFVESGRPAIEYLFTIIEGYAPSSDDYYFEYDAQYGFTAADYFVFIIPDVWGPIVVDRDDYYITHDFDGADTFEFDIDKTDPAFAIITEGSVVTDARNKYVIAKIDGSSYLHVLAKVDTRAFRSTFYENYDNGSKKLSNAVSAFLPSGWSFVNNGNTTSYRTLRLEYGTAFDLLNNCAALYDVRFNFNAKTKTLTAVNPESYTLGKAFVTEELNLRSLQYYGDSSELITRLEARGKDGLTFSSINGGKSYVENLDYTNEVIYGYWKDERYTVKEDLLDAAIKKLNEMSVPKRSYECDVIDLKSINPSEYSALDLSLYQRVSLKDVSRETSYVYQVVKFVEYPNYPEKNVVTLSTTAPKLTSKLQEIETEVQEFDGKVFSATSWLTDDSGGKIYFIRDNEGSITSMILKVGDAQNPPVWVFNKNGIGYSTTGISGTPSVAMTSDGSIRGEFIKAGVIKGGKREEGGHQFFDYQLNLDTGYLYVRGMDIGDFLFVPPYQSIIFDDTCPSEMSSYTGSGHSRIGCTINPNQLDICADTISFKKPNSVTSAYLRTTDDWFILNNVEINGDFLINNEDALRALKQALAGV